MSLLTQKKERLNLYLPKDIAVDLRRFVPARKRNRFVSQVLAQALRRLKLKEAIERSAGAWQESDHPELATPSGIDRWLEEGRAALEWDRPLRDGERDRE